MLAAAALLFSGTPASVHSQAPTYVEAKLLAAGVVASANDGNPPANTVDNKTATRWAATGDGVWIRYDLGSSRTVGYITVGVYQGNAHRWQFDVQLSDDGNNWTTVAASVRSSGATTAQEIFDFPDAAARYVRLVGHGGTPIVGGLTTLNALTEVDVFAVRLPNSASPTLAAPPPSFPPVAHAIAGEPMRLPAVGSRSAAANGNVSTLTAGTFPAGIPVTPYLLGQNYWLNPPDAAYPIIRDSGVSIMRIGGHTFDETAPLTDAQLLHQVDMIRSIGAEPLIQVSRFRTVAAAANTVQYINVTHGRDVKFWSIGNEPDLNFPGSEVQIAAAAAAYIKQFAPAMRDVDPTITILAPDMAFYSATKFNALLGGASDITGKDASGRWYIDCVSFHRYAGTTFTRADALADMHNGFETTRLVPLLNRIAFANSLQGRTGPEALTWALTEFNITTRNPANNTPAGYGVSSFLNGQFFAEYYRVAMKYGVSIMNSWSLLEGGGNSSAGDLGYLGGNWNAPVPRSSYYHMQMIADYMLPGGYIPSTSSYANLAVLSTSTQSQTLLAVMLLSEDTTGTQAFTIRMNDEEVVGGGTKINVSAGLAAEYSGTLDNQSTSVLIFDEAGTLKRRITYSLPRYLVNLPPLVEVFTGSDTVPAAPTGLIATSGDARATLSWVAPGATTAYNVKRSQVSGGPYTTVASGVLLTSYSDTGLTNGATYYYVVSAINAMGEGAHSHEVVAMPQAVTAPVSFEAENLSFTSTGSSTSVNVDTGASGGRWVQLNSGAAGPFMGFTASLMPGTYTVQLTYKANNNRGQLSFAVDGVVLGGILDQYASATIFVTKSVGTVTFASAGTHTFRLTSTGKNPASTGFLLSADRFDFATGAAATIALGNLNHVYDGSPKSASATTTPAGLNALITYNGSSSAPTSAGVYSVLAKINDPIYVGATSGTLIVAPASATVTLDNLDQAYDGTPKPVTVTTHPPGVPVQVTYDGSPLAPTGVGSYVVVGTVADANYVGSATQTLIIRDATPPTLTLPANVTAEATSPAGAIVSFAASANDDVDGSVPVVLSRASGSTFALGVTTVTATATDAFGNTASGSFTVTVQDTTPPVIGAAGDVVVEATGPNGAVVEFTSTASDVVDGTVGVVAVPASGGTFALGTRTVTLQAADAAGNTATSSFTVTVLDRTTPAIRVPIDRLLEATSAAGATATFSASADDIVDGAVAPRYSAAPGSTFGLGTTVVIVTATDAAGNIATGTFKVTVRDTTAPVIRRLRASPESIWPATRRMVRVTLTAVVTDKVDSKPVNRIVRVTREDADHNRRARSNGGWEITGAMTLKLRAVERASYRITVQSRDRFGNVGTRSITVKVARKHDGRHDHDDRDERH